MKSNKCWNQEMFTKPTVLSRVKEPTVTTLLAHVKVTLCLNRRSTSSMGRHIHTVPVFSVSLNTLPHFCDGMMLVLVNLCCVPPQEYLSPLCSTGWISNTLPCFHLASRSFQPDLIIQNAELFTPLTLMYIQNQDPHPGCSHGHLLQQTIQPSQLTPLSLFHFVILWAPLTFSLSSSRMC